MRRKVSELVACGIDQDDIARAIGCSAPTLTVHFAEELATGRAVRRAEVISLLFRQARRGNVTAQKTLEHLTGIAPPGVTAQPAERKKRQERKAGQIDAGTAAEGTEWAELLIH